MHCERCNRNDCRTAWPACEKVEAYELPDELSLVYHERVGEQEFEELCKALDLDPEEAARDLSKLDPHAYEDDYYEEDCDDPVRMP